VLTLNQANLPRACGDGKAAKRALVCDIAWAADLIVKHLAEHPAAQRPSRDR